MELHLIEKRDLWTAAGATHIRTGFWAFSPEQAQDFVGWTLFLHRSQNSPAHYAGRIEAFEIQRDGSFRGRIVFLVRNLPGREGATSPGGWTRWYKSV